MISNIFLSARTQISWSVCSSLDRALTSSGYNIRTSGHQDIISFHFIFPVAATLIVLFFFMLPTVWLCYTPVLIIQLWQAIMKLFPTTCIYYKCFFLLAMLFFTDIKSRITKLEDMKNRRLEILRNRHKDTYNAVIWLRENQHRFKSPVHEPILLQVSKWVSMVKNLPLKP